MAESWMTADANINRARGERSFRDKSDITQKRYREHLNYFLKTFGSRVAADFQGRTAEDEIDAYLAQFKPVYRRNILCPVRLFFRYIEGQIEGYTSPAATYRVTEATSRAHIIYPIEDLDAFLTYCRCRPGRPARYN